MAYLMDALLWECAAEWSEVFCLDVDPCWKVNGCAGGLDTVLWGNESVGNDGRTLFGADEECEWCDTEVEVG